MERPVILRGISVVMLALGGILSILVMIRIVPEAGLGAAIVLSLASFLAALVAGACIWRDWTGRWVALLSFAILVIAAGQYIAFRTAAMT